MQPIRTFSVSPSLPPQLEPLRELAYNLHWDWNVEARELFSRLDRDLWLASRQNPVYMLGQLSQTRLQEMATDDSFLAHMKRAVEQLHDYLESRTWYKKHRPNPNHDCVAYFCAEYGLTQCLPIYSGGLGVLAGDHLKSASDLGLPLVAVGLLYQEGYFSQHLNVDGMQQERYPISDFYNLPLHLVRQDDGSEARISVEYPGRMVYARIWRAQVGTVPLYLLDTNIEPNNRQDQDITDRLYGGDLELRIQQEIMLGIGGVRALETLGIKPSVYHLNEGHSAFLILERLRHLIQREGLSFPVARQVALATQIFTTHTPVSAGFDLFPPDMAMRYIGHYAAAYNLPEKEFLSLGRENTGDLNSAFSMAALALKNSSFINGVSRLHGEVSRQMFQGMWPGLPVDEVPITSVTNGVHARSVVAKSTQELYDRYLGSSWDEAPPEHHALWSKVAAIPDDELWRNHERVRSEMVLAVREQMVKHLKERDAGPAEIYEASQVLNPNVLTIGFARRFATYKRANLFLRDTERIKRIITGNGNPDRRVQFVISGKAHPKDEPGKGLIREIIQYTRREGISSQVVFVPNYDIHIARMLVAGCDVWLNTPRRPREASGTSGMKAAMNGLPNLSILDGWWDEADYIKTGWAIGSRQYFHDHEVQDTMEANALYECLEHEIIPMFYDRNPSGIPLRWVEKMKYAISLNCPRFNTARMLSDYALRAYFPASDRAATMSQDHYQVARSLAEWKSNLMEHWYDIKILEIDIPAPDNIAVGQPVPVTAKLHLANLHPTDIQVQLYQGAIDDKGQIINGAAVPMHHQSSEGQTCTYIGEVTYNQSGLQGLCLRVLPQHPHLSSPYEPGLILWAK